MQSQQQEEVVQQIETGQLNDYDNKEEALEGESNKSQVMEPQRDSQDEYLQAQSDDVELNVQGRGF